MGKVALIGFVYGVLLLPPRDLFAGLYICTNENVSAKSVVHLEMCPLFYVFQ